MPRPCSSLPKQELAFWLGAQRRSSGFPGSDYRRAGGRCAARAQSGGADPGDRCSACSRRSYRCGSASPPRTGRCSMSMNFLARDVRRGGAGRSSGNDAGSGPAADARDRDRGVLPWHHADRAGVRALSGRADFRPCRDRWSMASWSAICAPGFSSLVGVAPIALGLAVSTPTGQCQAPKRRLSSGQGASG